MSCELSSWRRARNACALHVPSITSPMTPHWGQGPALFPQSVTEPVPAMTIPLGNECPFGQMAGIGTGVSAMRFHFTQSIFHWVAFSWILIARALSLGATRHLESGCAAEIDVDPSDHLDNSCASWSTKLRPIWPATGDRSIIRWQGDRLQQSVTAHYRRSEAQAFQTGQANHSRIDGVSEFCVTVPPVVVIDLRSQIGG